MFVSWTSAKHMILSFEGLWKRLLDVGVNGKMWRVIRNIYETVESTVILGEELTDWFSVELGLKQGCTLSPLLFLISLKVFHRG